MRSPPWSTGTRRSGPRSPPAPPLLGFVDWVAWDERRLANLEPRLLRFWAAELDGAPARTVLPSARERPSQPSHRGGRVPVVVPRSAVAPLHTLARAAGATP